MKEVKLKDVIKFAINGHKEINHKFDTLPYKYHLLICEHIALMFIHLVDDIDRINVICGLWLHDTLEDCKQYSFNDVKKISNIIIAELSFALCNEKGRFRKDRANDKYYSDIKTLKDATFIKLCDRLANIIYSKTFDSSMYLVYKKEHEHFKIKLYDEKYKEMFDLMEKLYLMEIHRPLWLVIIMKLNIVKKIIIRKKLYFKILVNKNDKI